MLLGERLGGCHESRLRAVLDCPQHRAQRAHRLARSHLPHQQPLHGPLASEVRVDRLHRPQLVARELERQRPAPAVHHHAARRERPRPPALPACPTAPCQRELQQEQLLEGEPPARALLVLLAVGEVRCGERGRAIGEVLVRTQPAGERLDRVEDARVGVPDQLTQPGGADPLGRWMHWHEADRVHRRCAVAGAATEQLVLRHPELARPPQLAVQQHLRALRELAREPGLVPPHGNQWPTLVEDPRLDALAAAVAHRPDRHAAHRHRHRGFLADHQVGHKAHVAAVAV